MSGTSFDGVDAAIIKTDGEYLIEKYKSAYVEYTTKENFIFKFNYKKL